MSTFDDDITNENTVVVVITCNFSSFHTTRRFSKNMEIRELKERLCMLIGATPENMRLQLLDSAGEMREWITDDYTQLSKYQVVEKDSGEKVNKIYICVIDPHLEHGAYEDTSGVQKFELSPEEYAKRAADFLKYKQEMIQQQKEQQLKEKRKKEEELAKNISIGNRCEVRSKDKPTRRGEVKFVGEMDAKPGIWIGVKYDKPVGKNDGSIGGKRYFQCEANHGGFVKPWDVTVGDFPFDKDE